MTTMQDLVANIDHLMFDVETALDSQLGAQLLPFHGMDKTGSGICVYFIHGACPLGGLCPYRHVTGDKSVVCKHWLRGLCKKGDQCEFLHEYDLSKMPECYFFSKYSACSNKECPFRHIDPESKIKDCPWYDRGFCRHGPHCKSRHRRRVMCVAFMNGLCLEGRECKFTHPSFDVPAPDLLSMRRPYGGGALSSVVCHNCHERGHKATGCPRLPGASHAPTTIFRTNLAAQHADTRPAVVDVTCYKCGERGHYANRCPKGALAFLSQTQDGHLPDDPNRNRAGAAAWRNMRAGEMIR